MASNSMDSEEIGLSETDEGHVIGEQLSETAPTKKALTITEAEWARHKLEIKRVYVDGRKSLEYLRDHMRRRGLDANQAQYLRMIRKWGFQKKHTKNRRQPSLIPESGARLLTNKRPRENIGASNPHARPNPNPLSQTPVLSSSRFCGPPQYMTSNPFFVDPNVNAPSRDNFNPSNAYAHNLGFPALAYVGTGPAMLSFDSNIPGNSDDSISLGPSAYLNLPGDSAFNEDPAIDLHLFEDPYRSNTATNESINNIDPAMMPPASTDDFDAVGEPAQVAGTAGVRRIGNPSRPPKANRRGNYGVETTREDSSTDIVTPTGKLQPIHIAVQAGSISLVELFLEKSPKCADLRAEKGVTPLWIASQGGHTKIAKLLIENGKVDVNISTHESNRTPLHQAAQRGNEEIVKLLLAKGAKADPRDARGVTPLFSASQKGSVSIVKLLAGRKDVDIDVATVKEKRTPIHQAAQGGHTEVVKILLEHGAACDPRDNDGTSPLYAASQSGYTNIVEMLLKQGANAEVICTSGSNRRPFHHAATHGHTALCRLFLEYKVDFEPLDETNCSPLFFACQGGHHEIVEMLLQAGADCENTWQSQKGGGRRCLHQAAQNGHFRVVQLLLEAGADVDPDTDIFSSSSSSDESNRSDGSSPNNSETEVVISTHSAKRARKRFREKSQKSQKGAKKRQCKRPEPKTPSPLALAARNGYYDIVKLLVERGADVHSTSLKDLRPQLHQAVGSGKAEIVQYLLDKGAEVDAKDLDGWSAIMLAAQEGNCNIIQVLVDAGANVNSEANSGATALFIAAQQGHTAVVKVLLDNGARSFATNKSGRHPIHQAAQSAHFEVLKLLVEHDKESIHCKDKNGHTVMGLAAAGKEPVRTGIVRYLYEKGAGSLMDDE
ncbi:hypothetical protein TWF506_009238 [Arthrobotrys conoides]|uniref:Clr5 domain-containing protein n=1 Tax=Arthrobotrys conoides TaxID=74498 RepID=A0AAN8RWX5_9PEZI